MTAMKWIGCLLVVVTVSAMLSMAAAQSGGYQIQPIVTRYAKTAPRIYGNLSAEYFNGLEIQEADHFDGWTFSADLTIPFRHNMQIGFVLPFYTTGDARVKATGEKTDIEGNGGVFDFATLFFEHQIIDESHEGFNLGYYLGYGYRTDSLDTDINDPYNHRGQVIPFGVRYDQRFDAEGFRLLGNLGGRFYFDTDDLDPTTKQDGEEFFMSVVDGAAVFGPYWGGRLYPAAEVLLRTINVEYLSLSVLPELIMPVNTHLELKLAGLVGLTGDGENWGARFQITGRF